MVIQGQTAYLTGVGGRRYGDFLESGSYIKQRGRFATDDVPADEHCYLADPEGKAFEFVRLHPCEIRRLLPWIATVTQG